MLLMVNLHLICNKQGLVEQIIQLQPIQKPLTGEEMTLFKKVIHLQEEMTGGQPPIILTGI